MNKLRKTVRNFIENTHIDKFLDNEYDIRKSIIISIINIVNEIYQEDDIKHFMAEYYNICRSASTSYINFHEGVITSVKYITYSILYKYNPNNTAEFISNNRLAIECSTSHIYTTNDIDVNLKSNHPYKNIEIDDHSYERSREMLILPSHIYHSYRGKSSISKYKKEYIKKEIRQYLLNEILMENSAKLASFENKYQKHLALERELLRVMDKCNVRNNTISIEVK